MIKEYCYQCDKDVEIIIREETIKTEIKGFVISYMSNIAYCKECGEEVYVRSISDENINKANKEYNRFL